MLCPTHKLVTDYGSCPECRNDFHACSRCGQIVITRADPPVCQTCRRLERRSQGETVRLFEPAPNQMPGQLAL